MFDEDSLYNQLTHRSKLFRKESIPNLREKKLKQHWRNHLLGIRMVELGELDIFHSVHLYPEGNTYQAEACEQYQASLLDYGRNQFVPITFEQFIKVAKKSFIKSSIDTSWITYLKGRY